MVGALAQLVEQRTENPCVPGSIPGGTTKQASLIHHEFKRLFVLGISSMLKGPIALRKINLIRLRFSLIPFLHFNASYRHNFIRVGTV